MTDHEIEEIQKAVCELLYGHSNPTKDTCEIVIATIAITLFRMFAWKPKEERK
jgi:hypothetical protein